MVDKNYLTMSEDLMEIVLHMIKRHAKVSLNLVASKAYLPQALQCEIVLIGGLTASLPKEAKQYRAPGPLLVRVFCFQ